MRNRVPPPIPLQYAAARQPAPPEYTDHLQAQLKQVQRSDIRLVLILLVLLAPLAIYGWLRGGGPENWLDFVMLSLLIAVLPVTVLLRRNRLRRWRIARDLRNHERYLAKK
jgi:hypothetical protein